MVKKEKMTKDEMDQPLEDIGAGVAETDEGPELKEAVKEAKSGGTPADLEPKPVSEALSLEEQIEGWREQANELLIELNKGLGQQVDGQREKLWRVVAGRLNAAMDKYSKANETIGYVVLIERQKTTQGGFLRVNVRADNEGYQMVADIDAAVAKYAQEGADSAVEITSSMSESTKTDKILASTIAGYGLHTYPVFPEYVSPKKLAPLDDLPKAGINPGLTGGLKLNR